MNRKKIIYIITLMAFVCTVQGAGTNDLVNSQLFPLGDVRLIGGPLQRQQELNRRYLLQLEPDRLLSWFRKEAGLDPKAPPYRGWESENVLLPGHILGFYMSGASMTVQATGDEVLRERLLYIVDQLEEVQQANGSGYALALRNGKEIFREIQSGNIRIQGLPWNGNNINGHFEPTYTLNKVLLGLYQIILATDSEKAEKVFLRLSDWFGEEIVDKLDDRQLQTLLQCEHGSMPESFVDAYRLTGDEKYRKWARRLCHERMLIPLAEGRGDFLTHFHANSNIPKYTGFEHVHQIAGDEAMHRAAVNAWDEIINHRSWVVGGNGSDEHFFDPDKFLEVLRRTGPESCNSVNMLRLTEALYVTSPSASRMDYYERVLFNHILSSHDPERAMAVYFTPMFPGAYRVYCDAFDSMWCCTGTALEAPGKYGQMIYTHASDNRTLTVNLFAPSELDWSERGVTIRQETGFPYEQATTLKIDAPERGEEFTLRVRHPAWVPDCKLQVTLNEEPVDADSVRSSYFSLHRRWMKGDVLHIKLPMTLNKENLPGSDEYVAFLYGPIVLGGELGRMGGLTKEDFWKFHEKLPRNIISEDSAPWVVAKAEEDPTRFIEPVDGEPLHFRSKGFYPNDVSLIPFSDIHFQRYAVYWRRVTPEQMEETLKERERKARKEKELEMRTVDCVVIGDTLSEKDHALQAIGSNTGFGAYGRHTDRAWRDARDGGWFSYKMHVDANAPLILRCTFWGNERGDRTFDIFADNELLKTYTLTETENNEFIHLDLALPDSLIKGKTKLTVKFQAHPKNSAGGIFDLRILNDK